MTRASRIRQWRQYWDGLASAEAAQSQRDTGARRKLSKLPPSAVALFDRSQRDDLGTPDECAPSVHQQSDSDLPAVSSWKFQSPTPPPSYQELVLSGVIKPPQPPAPRKKHHRAHVQRAPPLVPLHPTPAVRSSVEDPSSHDHPTTGRPLQETAALDTQTLTSFPIVVPSAEQHPHAEDQNMGVIAAGQQKCTVSAGVTLERENSCSISSITVSEGARVRVVQSPDDILIPPQDTHEKSIVELREETVTPEAHILEAKKQKPHISSRYISAIGAKEESITSTRPKTSKVVHMTNKKRAQLEEVTDVPVRNVGPVKNVVIIPRTTMDDTSYTSVYGNERAMYRSGKMERVEVNANSFGSKVDISQDLSKKQEPRRETPTIVAREHPVGEASGNLASPAMTEAAVTSRPSGGDRRQKEKDKVSLAEFLALEAQDFDSEDLASVQKLSGLFDEKKARRDTPSKTQTPPRSPTRKPVARPAPVTASIGDSRDSEVQHLPEVKVPVVRVVVVEEQKKQHPPSPSPSRRASFSGELRSRPVAPAVAALRPWSPTPQPSAAASGDQGAEDAESRNRFERARMFFQSLEKSQGSSSRSGSLDSAPPFAEAEDSLSSQRTRGHNRRRRRSGDGGSVTPGGGVQWETGGPRWQSRLGERPGGSERLPRKVSERFHVRDLFRDVLGEGGVRGIPHQQAVLAALRSVESDGSRPVSPYEELAASGGISSPDPDPYPDADSDPDPDSEPMPELDCRRGCSSPEPQAYLSEYPYLPKTPTRQFRPRPALLQPTLIPRRELLKTE
ncbi:mediator of DNA damage checkpoint protein 1-like [Schistocerca piceifrons]|uniref:mediator of DNA damage checkpoint protein 1-like n=1 Tax=Schistocerca piceifrons TaxID=274613 RepID=UPI001F5E7B21|nr:mediator of DNA damage checkpoint protein 1-like [Schistocerca piceifrons]